MDTLTTDQQIGVGGELVSANGKARLVLQGDGNLVVYRTDTGMPLWASNTVGSGATQLIMQADGNAVVYAPSGPVFATNTWESPGSRIVMQDDANLVVYRPDGLPVWASDTVTDWNPFHAATGDTRLGVARWMNSDATLHPDGLIEGRTHIWCNWDLRGFTASSAALVLDGDGRILWDGTPEGQKHQYGVDGRLIPFSPVGPDRNEPWTNQVPQDVVASGRMARLALIQFLDPKNRLLEDLQIAGKVIGEAVQTVLDVLKNSESTDDFGFDPAADSGVVAT